ncbi:MAG: 4Fe-4S dicluster domain-containing protein [Deltaproteobacteria bacterium]|nr:4Fe-4S dicluster domain-containing protein [Deltaproteobacteria bacterium]
METLKSGAVVYNPGVCSACGICEIMCSLWHEGSAGPLLSRVNVVRDAFTVRHHLVICRQCEYPSCYHACPLQDKALCIDEATGALYIDEEECTACGSCIEACPFDPPRIKYHAEKQVAFKCDLCREREEGPICVEYCPFQALTYIPRKERA